MLELDAAGRSLRAIAAEVFGDAKLYDRVWRLLRSTRAKTSDEQVADRAVAAALVRRLADRLGWPGPPFSGHFACFRLPYVMA